jgi:hypothetical protein
MTEIVDIVGREILDIRVSRPLLFGFVWRHHHCVLKSQTFPPTIRHSQLPVLARRP